MEAVMILAVAAIVLATLKYFWLQMIRPWFRTSVANVIDWQGE